MRALTKTGPGSVGLADRQLRSVGIGLVRVRVTATGVCGTDLHIGRDEYPSEPPVTMGHEISGTVTKVGEGVDLSWLGRRVACETYFSTCEECRYCRDGRRNLCSRRRSLGSFEDGGFAPEVVLPARNLHEIPTAVDATDAALCEPLACVCHCLLDPPRIAPGDRVVVIGPGAMGLLSVQVAMAQGAEVTCAGLQADRHRLEVARGLGASTLTKLDDDTYDVVIECSGSGGGIATALRAAAKGGRVVQVGICGVPVEVPWDLILFKELKISSGFASTPSSWRRAMTLLESGQVDLAPLVSHVVPLVQWERAFELVGSAKAVKVVIDPS